MNDYNFGNKIYELRTARGYSQKHLAKKMGISDKAISKWETGAAKPETETLRRLALTLGVSIDYLLDTQPRETIPEITKLVITGGPCAGKSPALSMIQKTFSPMGYRVLFLIYTARELITC